MVDNDEGRRKLAAILAADVAGYSRLMGDDERATVATLIEVGTFANWISPPKNGVGGKPGDFEYVRIAV